MSSTNSSTGFLKYKIKYISNEERIKVKFYLFSSLPLGKQSYKKVSISHGGKCKGNNYENVYDN